MARIPAKTVGRAMRLALKSEYKDAINVITKLLARFPANPDLLTDRGHVYEFLAAREYSNGRKNRAERDRLYAKAARDYRRAVRSEPNFVRALVGIGDVLNNMGSPRRALGYYDRAIEAGRHAPEVDRDNVADAYFAKSLALRALGRKAAASACLAQRTRIRNRARVARTSASGRQPNRRLGRPGAQPTRYDRA